MGNMALLIFKFAAGVIGHSAAMMADAVHSLSDFLTDIIVILFVRVSAKPQDESHDYGHGKYETLASFFVGLALVVAAGGIIVSGAVKFASWLRGEQLPAPGRLALWAALVSIVVKELLYRYTVRAGKRLDSQAVVANAWHHRSDALSSIGAAIGIGGALLLGDRWTVLDPIAGLVVTTFILRVAYRLLKQGLNELLEASLPDEVEKEILSVVTSFPDVRDPHHLRTRRIGSRYAIELHIRMDGQMPLADSHARTCEIEQALKARFGASTHITLHVEPIK